MKAAIDAARALAALDSGWSPRTEDPHLVSVSNRYRKHRIARAGSWPGLYRMVHVRAIERYLRMRARPLEREARALAAVIEGRE